MNRRSSESHSKASKHTKSPGASRGSVALTDSKSSLEEGCFVDYDEFLSKAEEPPKLPPKTGEFYFQDYDYVKPTQSQLDRKMLPGTKLFGETVRLGRQPGGDVVSDEEPERDASILVTGFGMRNVKSFQKLIEMSHEERRKWELRKLWRDEEVRSSIARDQERREKAEEVEDTARSSDTAAISTSTETRATPYSSDLLTQTDTIPKSSVFADHKKHLDYLLGLDEAIEEEPEQRLDASDEMTAEEFKYSSSKSMRAAQAYLRRHRIFECFRFIVAHLLSAKAENPIEFILVLLNKCLLYRSGLGEPPLLYEKKHINQLFNLMDRLQSGTIEMKQYKMGMNTIGICSYNENPEVNDEDQVSRETFVEEAYEAELAIFNDIIRKRPEKKGPKTRKQFLSFGGLSADSLHPATFFPPDFFRLDRKDPKVGQEEHKDAMDLLGG